MQANDSFAAVQNIKVDDNSVGQRVDNYLLSRLKGVPKTRVYRIIRKGEVRVNGKRVKPDYKLQLADIVRIPPIRIAEASVATPSQALIDLVQEAILYEDESILVINKPSGLSVHAGTGVKISLIDVLKAIYENQYIELVHRIDKGTSGCILIAKTGAALRQLQADFKSRQVKKTYHALVHGSWPKSLKEVNASIQRLPESNGERKVRIDNDGKKSLTYFSVLKSYKEHSLLLAAPHTGRTHQIRVHAAFVGHPVCGDDKYSSKKQLGSAAKLGIQRLCLHAASLELLHPETGKPLTVNAPYDEKFTSALSVCSRLSGKKG